MVETHCSWRTQVQPKINAWKWPFLPFSYFTCKTRTLAFHRMRFLMLVLLWTPSRYLVLASSDPLMHLSPKHVHMRTHREKKRRGEGRVKHSTNPNCLWIFTRPFPFHPYFFSQRMCMCIYSRRVWDQTTIINYACSIPYKVLLLIRQTIISTVSVAS